MPLRQFSSIERKKTLKTLRRLLLFCSYPREMCSNLGIGFVDYGEHPTKLIKLAKMTGWALT